MFNVLTKPKARRPRVTERRAKKQKGSAMVESALVLLTVLGVILFIMDMGRIMLTEQFITERAQITVRQAAVNNWTASDVQNFLVYNNTSAPSGAVGSNGSSTPGLMGLLPSQVSYSTLGTAGTPDYRLQVTVSGVSAFTFIPGMSNVFTLPPVVATSPAQSLGSSN